jgi:S-adenosylmethionine-diacylglycerol 3-amino-3-carboxypropyl transferase
VLDHAAFLELVGARLSTRRGSLFDATLAAMPEAMRAFWRRRRDDVIAFGLGGVGKFERYFRIFRNWLLPIVHSRRTVAALSVPRTRQEREAFLTQSWNSWRWRLVLKAFFSRWAMGRLGRDPAFFQHVEGSVAEHVALRIRHAAVDLDPAANPYLHWILHGHHGDALPLAWRFEHYDVIRNRLDRLDIRHGAIESLVTEKVRADGFNLSDIFEYMAPETFTTVYGQILGAANPGARLVYWNMMAARSLPLAFSARVRRLGDVAERGKAIDKAFFYSDFHVEEVLG